MNRGTGALLHTVPRSTTTVTALVSNGGAAVNPGTEALIAAGWDDP